MIAIVDLKYIFANSQSFSESFGVKTDSLLLGSSCIAIGTKEPWSLTRKRARQFAHTNGSPVVGFSFLFMSRT